MKTDVITIHSDLTGSKAAMQTAEHFCEYNNITGKNAMHIRLLTEETVSMVHGILRGFKGKLWLESQDTEEGILCRICLRADKSVDMEQEDQLMSVSTSGKNESVKGVLGKIREIFRRTVQSTSTEPSAVDTWYYMGAQRNALMNSVDTFSNYWSLNYYRQNVEGPAKNQEAWDELEKSIIGKLADEVKIGLRNSTAEVIIEKTVKK